MDEPGISQLKDLLAGRDLRMELDRAALVLATIEYPGLPMEPSLAILDAYAAEVDCRTARGSHGYEFVMRTNHFLFEELGLRGDSEDYYEPRNSCLNYVLKESRGIPISLSVLYLEIARRLHRPVYGIGLPGHFIVQYNDGNYSTFIDPYHGGQLLTPDQCYDLACMSIADPRVLAPVNKRQILFRMINNLRGIYFSRRAYPKALQVMNLLIDVSPGLADQYKQRALLYIQMEDMRLAWVDLQKYLQLAPDAEDKPQVEHQLKSIVRWLASLN